MLSLLFPRICICFSSAFFSRWKLKIGALWWHTHTHGRTHARTHTFSKNWAELNVWANEQWKQAERIFIIWKNCLASWGVAFSFWCSMKMSIINKRLTYFVCNTYNIYIEWIWIHAIKWYWSNGDCECVRERKRAMLELFLLVSHLISLQWLWKANGVNSRSLHTQFNSIELALCHFALSPVSCPFSLHCFIGTLNQS